MANSINVASLTKYTDQLASSLIREYVLRGRTIDMVSVQTGIKYAEALNIMTSTLTAAAGGTCGAISPAGGPVLTQRSLQVCPLKVEEAICLNTLEQYWMGQFMKNSKGSYQEEMASGFAEVYVADKVAKLQALVEDLFWAGDTVAGSGNLALCNGVIKTITGLSGVVNLPDTVYSPSITAALTAANAIAQVELIIAAIPTDILDVTDLTMFMSHANFRTLVKALRTANNFYTDFAKDMDWEFYYPGTNIKVVAVRGLSAVNSGHSIILTPASNLYFGTDLMNDAESFSIWYDINTDTVYFRAKWKQGVQVAYPQYVVNYYGEVIS